MLFTKLKGIINKYVTLTKIKKKWPTCNIRSVYIALDGSCDFGTDVQIPPMTSAWGTYIGDYSYVGNFCSLTYVTMGKWCAVGNRCTIGAWHHDYNKKALSIRLYREILHQDYLDHKDKIEIGNDVWIGDNVTILKGKIGDGAVIGAGSVVTKDIPPYAIAVGNPAKVIKYRFDEEKIKQLLEEKWWDKEIEPDSFW